MGPALVVGDAARVYDQPNTWCASEWFSKAKWHPYGTWNRILLGAVNAPAADVEAAMVSETPAILETELDAACVPHHWVVAYGREPAVDRYSARGTYRIRDPEYAVTRLLEAPHGNLFMTALGCSFTTSGGNVQREHGGPAREKPGIAKIADADGGGLAVSLSGPVRCDIVDHDGGSVTFDVSQGRYISNIGNVVGFRNVAGDSLATAIEMPDAADGEYLIKVRGVGTGSYALQTLAVGSWADGSRETFTGSADSTTNDWYRLSYSRTAGTLTLAVADVEHSREALRFGMAAWPNPTREGGHVRFVTPMAGSVELTMFDVNGRKVRQLVSGVLAAGKHDAEWGAGERGPRLVPGVYFLRLTAGGERTTRRIVVLR
jgi:hypothetical protein